MACVIVIGGALLRRFLTTLPSLSQLEEYKPSLVTRVYDRKENLIAQLFTERRALMRLDEMPAFIKTALLASEDDQFFEHYGFSPKGIARALLRDIAERRMALKTYKRKNVRVQTPTRLKIYAETNPKPSSQ